MIKKSLILNPINSFVLKISWVFNSISGLDNKNLTISTCPLEEAPINGVQ